MGSIKNLVYWINLKVILITLGFVLIAAVAVGSGYWYLNRPDYLYSEAVKKFHEGNNLVGDRKKLKAASDDDLVKARKLYEDAQTQIEHFLAPNKVPDNDPRLVSGHMLRAKILSALALVEDRQETKDKVPQAQRKSPNLRDEAVREAGQVANNDSSNVEAQAMLLNFHFGHNDYRGAYPYAKKLIENLPPDTKDIEIEDLNTYLLGAYFLLAEKEVETNHPEKALKLLDAEARLRGTMHDDNNEAMPGWRAIRLRLLALREHASSKGQPEIVKKAEARFQTDLNHALDVVREDVKKTAPATDDRPAMPRLATLSPTHSVALIDILKMGVERADSHEAAWQRTQLMMQVCQQLAETQKAKPHIYSDAVHGMNSLRASTAKLPAANRLHSDEMAEMMQRTLALNETVRKNGGAIDPSIYADMSKTILATGNRIWYEITDKTLAQLAEDNVPAPIIDKVRALKDKDIDTEPHFKTELGTVLKGSELTANVAAIEARARYNKPLELLKRGLEVAAQQRLSEKDPRVLELHSAAALQLLRDHDVRGAEEHLNLISKQKQLLPQVAFLRGLGAVMDGRLEEGITQLSIAYADPHYKTDMRLLMALSHALLGMGQIENALPILEAIQQQGKAKGLANPEDETWRDLWLKDLTVCGLRVMTCHLALAGRATDAKDIKYHEDQAKFYYRELQPTYLADEATATLLNYKIARMQRLRAKNPGSLQVDFAQNEIDEIRAHLTESAKKDVNVLWADVRAILAQPQTNSAVVAAAVAASLSAPTDMANRLAEYGRLKAGFSWQVHEAEERIRRAAAEQPDSLPLQETWVRWLAQTGRIDDALAKLNEMENEASDDQKKKIQIARTRLLLSLGRTKEAEADLEQVRLAGADTSTEILYALTLLAQGKADLPKAKQQIEKVLSKADQNGLYLYWEGQLHQVDGDYTGAIEFYERSIQFTAFKGLSENAIFGCLRGIANGRPDKPGTGNPEAAFNEAKRLRQAHPRDPVILAACAAAARQMDQVYGPDGMEGALADLIKYVGEEKNQPRLQAAVLEAAHQWVAAGRPDRARQELKANGKHLPSLALAAQLALADEDWDDVAEKVKIVTEIQPDLMDLPLWSASLHAIRSETKKAEAEAAISPSDRDRLTQESVTELKQAREGYQKFITDHPDSPAGYLALAKLDESTHHYKEALDWVKKWRDKMPDELNGFETLVRILAEDGRADDAAKEADTFINAQVDKARKAREEWEAKNPIKETDAAKAKEQTEQRTKERARLGDALKLTLTLQTAGALQRGKASALAEQWLTKRAQPLLDAMPEEVRQANQLGFRLVHASLNLEQGRRKPEHSPEREKFMDAAIAEYDAILKDYPNDLVAGNNLAWLLVKEKDQPARARALIDQVSKGKFSRQPIEPERLPLELLDTIGVVYRANNLKEESIQTFKKATASRYAREPRLLLYLGLAQMASPASPAEAAATLQKTINLADQRRKQTIDPARKEQLAKVVTEATAAKKDIGLVGGR